MPNVWTGESLAQDHPIPNRMSTDTPRTIERLHLLENEHDDVAFESLADFAKKLEREVIQLRARVQALELELSQRIP